MKFLWLMLFFLVSSASAASLFEFSRNQGLWYVRNDSVMGGISSSQFRIQNGVLEFTGRIRLENGGGFSGIRTVAGQYDLSGFTGLRLRLRGDGKRYALQVGDNLNSRISYWFDFSTKAGVWQEIAVPFSAMRPRRSGELVQVRALDKSQIVFFGMITRNPTASRFKLEVDWLRAY
jgi:NADH dehydrogenase [ubiquinone] 1 alpha subcomplex assembly factor 1